MTRHFRFIFIFLAVRNVVKWRQHENKKNETWPALLRDAEYLDIIDSLLLLLLLLYVYA